jgi:hypothetical protein
MKDLSSLLGVEHETICEYVFELCDLCEDVHEVAMEIIENTKLNAHTKFYAAMILGKVLTLGEIIEKKIELR